jgi:peptidoglycan/xylan/chitin deacetylase (PgdA/CDA1 family)
MDRNLSNKKIATLTIDVEEWYHLEYFKNSNTDKNKSVMDGLTTFIRMIESHNIKASFFIVGELIQTLKKIIKHLDNDGHDIGLHSYSHKRPVEQNINKFIEDTKETISEMRNILPNNSFGYRSPCFAIDRERLNEVIKLGIKYDASKITQKEHPLYVNLDLDGFEKQERDIYKKDSFKVFEVSTIKFLGVNIPIAGGGYLRIIPWPLYIWLLKKYLKKSNFINFFIHPFELSNANFELPENTPSLTKFRYNYKRNKVEKRLNKIIILLKENGYIFKTFSQL